MAIERLEDQIRRAMKRYGRPMDVSSLSMATGRSSKRVHDKVKKMERCGELRLHGSRLVRYYRVR